MDEWHEIGIRVIGLTRKLVTTLSVVDSNGEANIADILADYLREQSRDLPHVEVSAVEVPKPTACRAVMAYCPAAIGTERTLLLMGHTDTVGLEPYGPLASLATDSTALKEHYAKQENPAIAQAAQSKDWAFGRGWLDMKGGVAAIVEVFLREARERELPVNLVLLLTPDEESASRGLRALVPELIKLKAEHGLEFEHVVNADYVSPLTETDENRYFYSGVVGKFLVGVSVFGRTTHVGETFGGVNASALAGYLAYGLEHDRKLMAGVGGEWLPPPSVLHMGDRRQRYDVMTLDCAELYVNVFHLSPEPQAWWRALLNEVRRLVNRYDIELRRRYNRFVAKSDQQLPRYDQTPEVIDFDALAKRVEQQTNQAQALVEQLRTEAFTTYTDERQRALHVIRGLHGQLPPGRPVVVVSLLPPFYPAQDNTKQDPHTAALIELTRAEGLKHKRIYPYISDMSYFCFSDRESLAAWAGQSPVWFDPAEIDDYGQIAARVCNIGPWGIGAHTAEERVHLPYLRDTLPRLLSAALHRLAGIE